MKTLMLVAALAALVTVGLVAPATAAPADDPRTYCAARWPQNYYMQVDCVQQEQRARSEVGGWSNAEPQVYAYCYYRWDSWFMVADCGKSQLGARRQLQQMPSTPAGCVDYGKVRVCG